MDEDGLYAFLGNEEKTKHISPLFFLVGQRRVIVGQTFRQSGGVEGSLLGAGR